MLKQKRKTAKKYSEERKYQMMRVQSAIDKIPLFFDKDQIQIYSEQCVVIKQIQTIPSRTKFLEAQKYLSGESTPTQIVGREQQSKQILKFLKENAKQEITHSFPLIISGVPGIGKTMTVKAIAQKFASKTKFPLKVININLMKLRSLNQTIPCLFSQICPSLKVQNMYKPIILESMFSRGQHQSVSIQQSVQILGRKLLIIDQVQFLATQNHKQILYCLLNWLHYRYTNMLMIIISNQMSFNVYASRLGTNQLVFKPYSSSDMLRIVQNLLKQLDIFDDRAMQYAIKKIAVCSSDIRKIIHLLTLSIRLCQQQNQNRIQYRVSLCHIKESYIQMYKGATSEMVKILLLQQKLLLVNICAELKANSQTYCLSNNLHLRFQQHMRITEDMLNYMLVQIKSKDMITMKEKTVKNLQVYKIELRVEVDYIIKALEQEIWTAPFLYQLLK